MPVMVRRAHRFELSSSMLVSGGIAGWVVHGNEYVGAHEDEGGS